MIGTYLVIFVVLLALELCYFKIADKFNIIDKPNERSSHSTIVLRGGRNYICHINDHLVDIANGEW